MGKKPSDKLYVNILKQMPFIIVLTIQSVLAYFFWLAYGTLALVIGPLRSWSIILNVYLWYKAITLPAKYTRFVIFFVFMITTNVHHNFFLFCITEK